MFPLSGKRFFMSHAHKILLKLFKEPVYLKYPSDIFIRTEPHPELKIYAKRKEGNEHLINIPLGILKKAVQDCIEITKEEYESY